MIKNQWRSQFPLLLITISILVAGRFFTTDAQAALTINSKTLTPNKAIASWASGIPAGEKRPVIVFLPGWGGVGGVDAAISAQNTNLVNQGYVTLAIGFDSSGTWNSDIEQKTLDGLNKLCADTTI
ncbi:MAG TPA: hypothetical protein PLT08_09205, partial [Anaerolineales bacterium]|nr:hypothetical protein [Anaerolineales bacterium]